MKLCCTGLSFCLLVASSAFCGNICAVAQDGPLTTKPEASAPIRAAQPAPQADKDAEHESGIPQVMNAQTPGVTAPRILHSVDPKFPREGRHERTGGMTLIGLLVDKSGMPQNVHVIHSFSNNAAQQSGLAQQFDKNAMESVKKYRFAPSTYKGQPVVVELHVAVNFIAR